MRAIIHCHSNFSYDSKVEISDILNFCLENEVGLLILSDHNNVQGSLEAASQAREQGLNIICPPSAEYRTEFGDIILVGWPQSLETHDFQTLLRVSKEEGCGLLLPHPYHDHTNIEYIAKKVDFIEVFNSRCSSVENDKAIELARLMRPKNTYASPDAHLLSEYTNCIIEYDTSDSKWDSIMEADWTYQTKSTTNSCNVYKSALIKSLKTGAILGFLKSSIKVCLHCIFLSRF